MRSNSKWFFISLIAILLSVSRVVAAQVDTQIYALAWNPTGTILAAAGRDITGGVIWFYDVDGQLVDQISVSRSVLSVAWSPDGSKIAGRIGSEPDTFAIWDSGSYEALASFEQPGATFDDFAYWNPAGDKLATVSQVNVLIYDAADGITQSILRSPGSNLDSVYSVAWNADGSKLFAASADNVVRVWDVATASILDTFQPPDSLTTMALSPDRNKLAIGLSDRTVQIWDAANGNLLGTFQGSDTPMPGGSVAFLKWHPNGNQIAVASFENIKIWDLDTSTTIAVFPQIDKTRSWPEAMDYSIDGRFAYVGEDGQIVIIDPLQLQAPTSENADA
jgi:WD40 repeat protein